MSDDIGQRFLQNAVESYRNVTVNKKLFGIRNKLTGNPGPLPELFYLPLDRC